MDATAGTASTASTSSSTHEDGLEWGSWMGAWKKLDVETERLDRQQAALGSDSVSRIKDLNILVLGCSGVGVEASKNLILSNVGSLTLWDPTVVTLPDLGTNFYLTADHVQAKTSRAKASLDQLKSLNPFCKVQLMEEHQDVTSHDVLSNPNVAGTGRPFSVVLVTSLSILDNGNKLYQLDDYCRSHGMAFVLACNHGVTCSIFSDFGTNHEISDPLGEPTKLLAISNIEVVPEREISRLLDIQGVLSNKDPSSEEKSERYVILITVAQSDHGMDDGHLVVLDDMRTPLLQPWNGLQLPVSRVSFQSPTAAHLDTRDVTFTELLKESTLTVVANFEKQYQHYHQEWMNQQQQLDDNKNIKKFPVRTITMLNRLAIVVDPNTLPSGCNIRDLADHYQSGGLLSQVRPSIFRDYASLRDTLMGPSAPSVPQMMRGDDWEHGVGVDIHLAIAAVLEFQAQHHYWPALHSEDDAHTVFHIAQTLSKQRQPQENGATGCPCFAQKVSWGFCTGEPRNLDRRRIRQFSRLFATELTGFCAFLGGAAAQEVLKSTGKYTPIDQWIHHDELCLISTEQSSLSMGLGPDDDDHPNHTTGTFFNTQPLFGSRYDHQMAILGKDFQQKLANQTIFLVGCGALGCEYLKGMALMGVATGPKGHIYVTDMDRIEVSNLSRQFLFRDKDVGSPKSVSGARVVKGWNPQLHITALERKVGPDTQDFFDDAFWESLSLCWNALDNVMARKYTDQQCLIYSKPLLESGTLGTKCNHEVILPYRTSTYSDGKESDENETQIAMCTLRSFPFLPLHCIEFAKQAYFSDYFEFGPDQYETFRKDSNVFFEQLESMEPGEQHKSLQMIASCVKWQQQYGTLEFEICVKMAFERLMADFRTGVLNLVYSADQMEKSSGKQFWTGTKRRPRPVDWSTMTSVTKEDDSNRDMAAMMKEYLYATSNMYASVWGLEPVRDRQSFDDLLQKVNLTQPDWVAPSQALNFSDNEEEDGGSGDDAVDAEKLKLELYKVDTSTLMQAFPHDFEKDDDSNFHVDFLTVATNLRSWNYDIKLSPRHTVKVVSGRIIPALATTTAMVCGLVDIEFCKLVLGLESRGRDLFLNSNINLAAGSGNFTTFSPDPPIALTTGLVSPKSFTSWDKIIVTCGPSREWTVQQLVEYVESSFGVTVDRIFSHGDPSDKAIFSKMDQQKLEWEIILDSETGNPQVSEGVFIQWPQIRMAVQMLGRLPSTSGQRKIFEGQINKVKEALDTTKESFQRLFEGPVSKAYTHMYRPTDAEEDARDYFDRVHAKRDFLLLGVHSHTLDNVDIHLPCIKYIMTQPSIDADDAHALKRIKIGD